MLKYKPSGQPGF